MARLPIHVLAPIAVCMAAVGALAHAFLEGAVPPVGGTVTGAPREIRLTFSEGVEPRFSGIELSAEDGRAIATEPARIDPSDNKELVLPLPPLPPGHYHVHWHVVSVDTHRTEGDYNFEVAR